MGFVTVTHPHHPLRGQNVALIRVRRGSHPDLIVRLPDDSHAAIAASMTDYGRASDDTASQPNNSSLLDLERLRQLVQLIDQFRK